MPRTRNRRMAPPLAAALLLGLLAGIVLPGTAAARRPITETDLFRFVWVADPRISPDGRQVAFVRVTVNAKKDGYDTALWVVATDGSEPPRPLTSGPRDTAPRWSPSGRQLAFERAGGGPARDGERERPQIYLLDMAGGEARALTDLPGGAGRLAWSPDGRTIAFSSGTSASDIEKKAAKGRPQENQAAKGRPLENEAAKERKDGKEERDGDYESDVRVITRAHYRQNGAGYTDPLHPAHIWAVDVPADPAARLPEPRQLTRGDLDDGPPVWSPDGATLYFVANRDPEPYYKPPHAALFAVPAKGDEPAQVAHGGNVAMIAEIDGALREVTPSPDGKRIALTGVLNGKPERSYNQPDLFVVDRGDLSQGASPRNLTAAYDYDMGGSVGGDQRAPRGGEPTAPVWSRDLKTVYEVAAERGRSDLKKVDVATGRVVPLTAGDHDVICYTATPDGGRFALVISTPTAIGDLWVLETASGRLAQLTRFNDSLFAELDLTPPEEITYKSFDGRPIEAWVQKPPGFDPAKKYPLILDIHGGPHAAYGWTFDHEFQWMAAKGYVVLYPNPRGSSSYGQEFGNVIQYHYPGDDFKDLMAGVDELIRRGSIDPQKLGVTGGSGGGVLTNWVIGHTDRFAAAVSQRSIADWSDFWYTADFTLFTPTWFKGAPWEEPEDFRARSPITYVTQIKTPLMLIEGEADYRTPPGAGGEQLFRALKYLKKPVVMVRFPGESHELSRSGRPWHRVERLRHIVGWFDKYLQGKKIAAYAP
jgi:dipeptidyl aminopeptidase/acylaminoacyl peptidase